MSAILGVFRRDGERVLEDQLRPVTEDYVIEASMVKTYFKKGLRH